MSLRIVGVIILTIWLMPSPVRVSANNDSLDFHDEWAKMEGYFFSEASDGFNKANDCATDCVRERDLGRALSLLYRQPTTRKNIDEARVLLEEIILEKEEDFWGQISQYYLARLYQIHTFEVDRDKAGLLFLGLFEKFPESIVAQRGMAKYANILLFENITPEERLERLRRLVDILADLTDPVAKKDVSLALANACQLYRISNEKALQHYLTALDIGILASPFRANTLVRAAEIAYAEKQFEIAVKLYQEFLSEFERDNRVNVIKERLVESLRLLNAE